MTAASAGLAVDTEVFPHDRAAHTAGEIEARSHEARSHEALTREAGALDAGELTAGAATRLRRLARGLAPFFAPRRPGLLVLAELTAPSPSAVWLSSALARVLAVTVDSPVHLLLANAGRSAAAALKQQASAPVHGLFTRAAEAIDADDADTLTQQMETRIRQLQAEGRSVLVYRPDASRWISGFEHDPARTGCVLLARASKARKAAVQSFHARLTQADIPLLGAVLLDREYPIPEALYRML